MAVVKICDLCHQPISPLDQSRKFKVKIKERKCFVDYFDRAAWDQWVEIDAHHECVKKLFNSEVEPTPPVGGSSQQDD